MLKCQQRRQNRTLKTFFYFTQKEAGREFKEKGTENRWGKLKIIARGLTQRPALSIITLNVNSVNTTIKRQAG